MIPATMVRRGESGEWLTGGRFAAVLGLLVFATFPQILLGVQTFVYRDFGMFTYPVAHHLRESFWRGEVPLWNPLNACGLPFLAQWNTQTLYPPALLYLLLPLSWSLGLFCLAHLFLGGLGMFHLARHWTGDGFAAAVAGVAYAFSGLMFNCLMWSSHIAALGWLPWVVWRVEGACREGGVRAVLTAAAVGALQMLTGAPEIILLTWVLVAALVLVDAVRGPGSGRGLVLRLAGIVVLIAGLCAAQLLPFFDLLAHSSRQEGIDSNAWAMPLSGLGNFLVPLFHCFRTQHGVFVQAGQYWTASYYVGVGTVALAFLAVGRQRPARVWVLLGLALVCLVLALGDAGFLFRWARHYLPGAEWMRYPIKFIALTVFVLPLLAAYALAEGRQRAAAGQARFAKQLGLIAGLVAVLFGVVLWQVRFHWYERDDVPVTFVNGLVRAGFFLAILLGLLAGLKVKRPQARGLLQLGVLLAVWLDLALQGPMPPTVNRPVYETALPRPQPVPQPGTARAMVSAPARIGLWYSSIAKVEDEYLSRRWALAFNCNLLEGIPTVDGFYSLYPREQQQVFQVFCGSTNRSAPRLLDFLGVSMITAPTNFFEWETRTNPLPLLTGGQQPVFADAARTLQALGSGDFDPRREVFLPLEARAFVVASNATAVQLTQSRFAANQIELEAETAAPAWVIAAQTYYPQWRAYVDGKPVPLWRANHAFQGLEIPAGTHQVRLVYEDRWFRRGVVISGVTLLLCTIVFVIRRGEARV